MKQLVIMTFSYIINDKMFSMWNPYLPHPVYSNTTRGITSTRKSYNFLLHVLKILSDKNRFLAANAMAEKIIYS